MKNIMEEERKLKIIQELLFYRFDTDLMDEINQVTFVYTSKYKKFKEQNNEK
jgi:hypothetical protein